MRRHSVAETDSDGRRTDGADGQVPLMARRLPQWTLPRLAGGILARRASQIILSVASVLLLLLSSSDLASLQMPENHATTDLSPIPPPPTVYNPYLTNPSAYPLPDVLPNETGAVTLPQLATEVVASIPVYQLAFVNSIPGVGNVVELQTGEYNASLAQSIYLSGFCHSACSHHLPIVWDAPIPIAAYGGATIQGDALATEGAWTFVAASANNRTAVFFSANYGTNGSWYTLTGTHPIAGGSPELVAVACTALLTTLTPTNLIASTFTLPCGKPWSPPPPPPTPSPPSGGGIPPSGGSPTVSIVIPSKSPNGSTVLINGTGFSSVSAVRFNGAPSSFSVLSTTSLTAVVPSATGIVPIQVFTTGGTSPVTCASWLTHGTALAPHTPEVSSVVPTAAPVGSTVTINGAYFQTTSGVQFGGIAATGVTLVGAGVLHATVPLGTGAVDVTVNNSVGTSPTSCADAFTIQAIPSVTSVTPDQGPAGSSTIILGTNFLTSASVYFGATLASYPSVVSSSQIRVNAPSGPTGTVNVTVHQAGYTSALSCLDNYTYGPAPPALAPQVEFLTPSKNTSFGSMVVDGYNFQSNATVSFGGVPAPKVYYTSSTALQVEVPLGIGTVPIQVSQSSGTSLPTCADRFTVQWPLPLANFTAKNWSLPRALGADPVVIGGNPYIELNALGSGSTDAILASNASNSEIVIYRFNGTSLHWVASNVVHFATFNASSPVTSLGQTSLTVPNGTGGQVTAVAYGQSVFGLFTTYFNGQSVAESIGSVNGGYNWSGPYTASSGVASVRDPEAAVSPEGYVYVTWRENSMGPWAVDQSVYWPSGLPLVAAVPLKGSGSASPLSAGPPTLLVDPFGRPVYAWTLTIGSGGATPALALPGAGWSNIDYTGDFVSAFSALETVRAGFNATVPADFENFGGPGVHSLRAAVNTTLKILENDTSNISRLCVSQQVSYGRLYPNVTTIDPAAVALGPALPSCPLAIGHDNSFLVAETGPMSADVYLEVGTSNLLEAAGLGSMPIPPWLTGLYSPPPLTGGAFVPGTGAKWTGPAGSAIQISPITLNSGTVLLNASGVFWEKTGSTNNTYNSTLNCGATANIDEPAGYSTNLTIKNQAGTTTAVYTFASTTQLPDVYVDNLRALRNGTWTEKVTVNYVDTQSSINTCPTGYGFSNFTKTVTPPAGWPKTFTQTLSGTYTTGLGYYPSNVTLNSTGVKGSSTAMNDTVSWQNTIYAIADAWLNQTGSGSHYLASWTNGSYQLPESIAGHGFQIVPIGKPFRFTALTQTKNSTVDSSWWPMLNGNQVSTTQPVETLKYTCTFNQLANYQKLWWYSPPSTQPNNITNLTTNGATITWFSNGNNSGWVAYTLSNGFELNQTAMVLTVHGTNGTTYYEYVAELNGLEPWSVYSVVAHVKTASGCAVYQNQTSTWRFQTQATFPLAEEDLPYDSISGEGGGAQLFFQIPESFSQVSTFLNGTLTYLPWNRTTHTWNTSAEIGIPLTTLPAGVFSAPGGLGWGTTDEINLTALTPNATYNASLTLNFTSLGGALVHAVSQPFSFWYAKDTSGDGLTDAEKARGWNVTAFTPQPYQYYSGPPIYWTFPVTANNASYATNGLVSDYVEKEFGLNPRTLDTAHSHMLDTWNLTFDLGTTEYCPTDFECWWENATNPFASPQYPNGSENGSAWRSNSTGPHTTVDDSSAYDAYVLWTGSTLSYLQGLVAKEGVGWLRAVLGYYPSNHHYTLTVEGKLSWGANPLSYSTPNGGYADGQRINPLGDTYLNVTVQSWYDNTGSGNHVAAFINANQTVCCFNGFPYAQVDASLYTHNVTAGSGGSTYGGNLGMTYTFPVVDTQEYARLNVSLVQNVGGTFSNVVTAGPLDVDLASPTPHWKNQTSGSNNLHLTYQAIAVYAKAPTYILVPKDNSSLSNLPLGLKRYTAEQNFVLIVVNATGTTSYDRSVSGVSYPLSNGTTSTGTYSVTLQPGLNNFLVPRALFLSTPFGQDVLNATITTIQNITGTLGNTGIDQYYNATQWLARVTYGGHNGFNYTGGSGYVSIYSNTSSQSCSSRPSLCGGVTANPKLEAGNQSLAIQAILTLNLSSHGAIADLLAGLVLNQSGNFSAWLMGATQYLPSLGIAPNVLGALANSVQPNAGAYPAPTSSGGNPLLNWGIVGAVIWNAVSGVAGAVEVFWNAVVAAAAYFAYLATEALSLLLGALHQAASVLKSVASAMLWVLGQLLLAVKGVIIALIDPPVKAIQSGFASLFAYIYQGYVIANASGSGGNPSADSLALKGLAPLFLTMAVIATVVTIAVTLALPVEPILGALAVFLPLILAAALGSSVQFPSIGSGSLNFASPAAMLNSAASTASSFLDPGCVGNNSALQTGTLAGILSASSVIVAGLLVVLTRNLGLFAVSLTLSLLALIAAAAAYGPLLLTTQQNQTALALSILFTFLSFGVDVFFALPASITAPQLAVVAAVSVGIDLGGIYLGLTTRDRPCR
jgi:IPT/TIG domain-containing protein